MLSPNDPRRTNKRGLKSTRRRLRYAFSRVMSRIWPRTIYDKMLREVFISSDHAFQPGPQFEEIDPTIGEGKTPAAKVIAFYLPQFHEFEENNRNWGAGFTEWTNIARNIPRYQGQIAPRTPRDLGYYNLMHGDIQKRQAKMARDAGVHGFCYYYYRFDEEPFMDGPIKRMLADPSVDFPFCVMWCNETWTRAWIGKDRSIIAEQQYSASVMEALVDDLAILFNDPRYIRIQGRPLFTIYRPNFLPDADAKIAQLRKMFQEHHGLDVLFTMAQTDHAVDPRPYGLDGAIEFTANKFNKHLSKVMDPARFYDTSYSSKVYDFDELIELSLAEHHNDYPLVRSVMPHWDKNPRQPGRGHVIHGSTPQKFENWTSELINRSEESLFFGERLLFVNAWNEWAESAYLEPDTHFGGAYLNSVARAVFRNPLTQR